MTKRMNRRQERGQSLVEIAISFTVVMMLLAGAVDTGLAFFSYVALHDAAQEGAVYGSMNPADTNGIRLRIRSTSSSPVNLSDTSRVTIANPVITGSACTGGAITVTVQYDYQIVMPLLGSVLGSQIIPLTASVTNTILSPKCP